MCSSHSLQLKMSNFFLFLIDLIRKFNLSGELTSSYVMLAREGKAPKYVIGFNWKFWSYPLKYHLEKHVCLIPFGMNFCVYILTKAKVPIKGSWQFHDIWRGRQHGKAHTNQNKKQRKCTKRMARKRPAVLWSFSPLCLIKHYQTQLKIVF